MAFSYVKIQVEDNGTRENDTMTTCEMDTHQETDKAECADENLTRTSHRLERRGERM
jgi:hypothetical protein